MSTPTTARQLLSRGIRRRWIAPKKQRTDNRPYYRYDLGSVNFFSTFYDPHSGMHIPAHHENEISAYLRIDQGNEDELDELFNSCWERRLGAFLNTEEEKARESMMWQANGVDESTVSHLPRMVTLLAPLPMNAFNRGESTMEVNEEDQLFMGLLCNAGEEKDAPTITKDVGHLLLELINPPAYRNRVRVIVSGNSESGNAKDIVELCQQLIANLEVTGPTMTSRLLADVTFNQHDDCKEAVEKCLSMGINKFSVKEDDLSWLGNFVKSQGKTPTFLYD